MHAFCKALALPALFVSLSSEAPPPPKTCEPAPIVIQTPQMAPNSTYVSDAEPPKRFSGAPKGALKIAFGQANIDELCGAPPCGKIFLGCAQDKIIVLPDPFSMDGQEFARIVRHELAHVNGWPATHGD